MKRKIILGAVLLIVVGAIIGYRLYSKKVVNYAEENPDAVVSAGELVQAFDIDTAAASKKYLDKIVRVSGVVKSMDSTAVVLGEEGFPSDVVVGLDDRNLKNLSSLNIGKPATLQGKVSGYSKQSGDSDDLLASLGGTTVNIDYAGVIAKN